MDCQTCFFSHSEAQKPAPFSKIGCKNIKLSVPNQILLIASLFDAILLFPGRHILVE